LGTIIFLITFSFKVTMWSKLTKTFIILIETDDLNGSFHQNCEHSQINKLLILIEIIILISSNKKKLNIYQSRVLLIYKEKYPKHTTNQREMMKMCTLALNHIQSRIIKRSFSSLLSLRHPRATTTAQIQQNIAKFLAVLNPIP